MRRLFLLLCFCLIASVFPIPALAGVEIDSDHNGIHIDDLVRTMQGHPEEMDLNKDGKVDAKDLQSFMKLIDSTGPTTPKYGAIQGKVVDNYSAPVFDADVSLEGTTITVKTLSDGTFTISNVPVSFANRLIVKKTGYTDGFSNDFSILPGNPAVIPNVVLTHNVGSVTGLVYGPDHHPLQGVLVMITGGPSAVQTDLAGRYTINGVPVGQQIVTVQSSVYGSLSGYANIVQGMTVSMQDFVFTGIAPTTGLLTGVIQSNNGTPIHNATVTVTGTIYSGVTDMYGSFSIANLPTGLIGLTVTADTYETKSLAGILVQGGTNVINPIQLNPWISLVAISSHSVTTGNPHALQVTIDKDGISNQQRL